MESRLKRQINLAGEKVGRLTPQWPVGYVRNKQIVWLCVCDCGNLKLVERGHLRGKVRTSSCGCLRSEKASSIHKHMMTHGLARRVDGKRIPEYKLWCSMRRRCNNPNDQRFHHYGGRGIRVCERWDLFENFIADVGPRPTSEHSLDRINNDGNYEPANVRWATDSIQARNRRKIGSLTAFSTDELIAEIKRRGL